MLTRASLVVVAILVLVSAAQSQPSRLNLSRAAPALQVGNSLWIGTPTGLYQYNAAEDSYKRFAIPGRQPEVRQLFAYKEWLWCVLDSGLAALQIRLNDWLVFDTTNGLPSMTVTGIDFREDEVWISTPNGLARFDLLIEQWETYSLARGLPSLDVIDVRVIGDELWIASSAGLFAYEPRFEKWRTFAIPTDSIGVLSRGFLLGGELWLIGKRGLLRFNTQLQRSQHFLLPFLSRENLIELYLEESRIWAVTRQGLFSYEKQSEVWRDFEGNQSLQNAVISNACITPEQIWISAETATLLWNRVNRTWEMFDYSSGLSGAGYPYLYADGTLTLLFKDTHLDYRRAPGSPWKNFPFAPRGTGAGTGDILTGLFDNPNGGSLAFKDYGWSWQGTRITLLQNGTRRVALSALGGWETTHAEQYDVKSQIDMPRGRRLAGFYNTIDFTETKYGIRFRGNDSDYVRDVTWGDFRREPGLSPFTVPAEMFGTSLWMQAGRKTERFKRSLASARGVVGDVRSRKAYQHFSGATTVFSRTISDRSFARQQFFPISSLPAGEVPQGLDIFVDDASAASNTSATLERTTIGGLLGDFDRWRPVDDYSYDPRTGLLRLLRPAAPDYRIAARYFLGGMMTETVVQAGVPPGAHRENVYLMGIGRIIPSTLAMEIRDSLGRAAPLSSFGLDSDGDGRLDDEWIDYESGILRFPALRPFSPEVYDATSGKASSVMVFSGRTEVPILSLDHSNLVRGSESVMLDGLAAAAGNDYLLDYSNGTLLFIREGVVNSDTRIEVEYEYYDAVSSGIRTGSIAVAPSDQLFAQVEWQRHDRDSTNVVNFVAELRQTIGSFDVRLIPSGLLQADRRSLTGRSFEGIVSSSRLRVQSRFEEFDPGYRNLYHPESVVGKVHRRWQVSSSLDCTDDLRVGGSWKETEGFASSTGGAADRAGSASILFHREDLPGNQLQLQSTRTSTGDTATEKRFLQNLLEYQLPSRWASAVAMKSIRLEQMVRYGRQSGVSALSMRKDEFLQTSYRLNTIITDQFQAGFFYRSAVVHDVGEEGIRRPVSSAERLLADLSYGELRFLQVNARLENTLQQSGHPVGPRSDYVLRQFVQGNVRFSPGVLLDVLSSLYFEVNHTRALSLSGVSPGEVGSWLWRLSPPEWLGSDSRADTRTTSVKNEFRPGSRWLLQSLFEWTEQDLGAAASIAQRHSWRLSEKLDLKVGLASRLIVQYRQNAQDFGYDRISTDYEPSVWLEHRWSQDVMTIAQLIYRRTESAQDRVTTPTDDWQSTFDLVWRATGFWGMRQLEMRQTLSGSYRTVGGIPGQQSFRISSATGLDLYPIHSLIIRLKAEAGRFEDMRVTSNSLTTLIYSMRISLQL